MDVVKTDNVIIENLIYEVCGKQVMIDSELKLIYYSNVIKKITNQFCRRVCKIRKES